MKSLSILLLFFTSAIFAQHQDHQCAHTKRNLLHKTWNKKPQKEAGGNIDVSFYDIYWNVDPAIDAISGNVETYFSFKNSSDQLTLDLSNTLNVDSITQDTSILSFDHQDDIITIYLPEKMRAEEQISVKVYYHGNPAKITDAFTQSTHNGTPVIWTLSEPYGAKEWWPCKQSLSDKADSVDISIEIPNGNKAASNGVLTNIEDNGDTDIFHWQHRHPIVTYLVAIAVTNYDEFSETVELSDGTQVDVLNYVYPESYNSWINDMTTGEALIFFSDLFTNYPFADEKYGHAEFSWGGGMEHQTMSFMANLNSSLVVHELAHQWFGDFITCGSWADIWLNEGFATYCEGLFVEWKNGQSSFTNWKSYETNYIVSQAGGSVYVYDTTDVWNIFDGRLSYAKAGMVLHMMRKQVGDDLFFQAINNYLNDPELADGFALTNNLQSHFENAADTTFTEFFDDWIYNEGYPQYDVTWQAGTDRTFFEVMQTPSHSSVDLFEMKIPLHIIGQTQDTLVWLHHTENGQVFEIPNGFEATDVEFDPYNDMISNNNSVVEGSVVGFSEVNHQDYRIYPNPSKKYFVVSGAQISKIRVMDTSGRTVDVKNNNSNRISHSLSAGVYFVEISDANGNQQIQKLIIR